MIETHQPLSKGGFFSFLAGISLWILGFALSAWVGPQLPKWSGEFAFVLTATLLVGLSIGFIIGASRLALHRTAYLIMGLLALGLVMNAALPMVNRTRSVDSAGRYPGHVFFLTLALNQTPAVSFPSAVSARNAIYSGIGDFIEETFPEPVLPTFVLGLAQLLLASGLGLWIGSGVDKTSHLIPVALVAGLADIWSVSAGATAVIIQSPTIHYFLLHFPRLGGGSFSMPCLIGLSDFLFFGIFYQAAVKFELGVGKNILLLSAAFVTAVVSVAVFVVGLPVLPFMAVFFVAGNFRHLRMTSEDIREMLVFCLGVVTVGLIATRLIK